MSSLLLSKASISYLLTCCFSIAFYIACSSFAISASDAALIDHMATAWGADANISSLNCYAAGQAAQWRRQWESSAPHQIQLLPRVPRFLIRQRTHFVGQHRYAQHSALTKLMCGCVCVCTLTSLVNVSAIGTRLLDLVLALVLDLDWVCLSD